MKLAPRYDGPAVVSIDGQPGGQLLPGNRQRERLHDTFASLTAEQWRHPSRCEGWTVREVAAHLVSVTEFWNMSVLAGLGDGPTRLLVDFDPAAVPPLLVGLLAGLTAGELVDRLGVANDGLNTTFASLTHDQWSVLGESPAGHVPLRLIAQHALWDSWIHERDVVIPLAIEPTVEPDEVASALQFAAMVSPVLGLGLGRDEAAVLGVEATDPGVQFVMEVDQSVSLRSGPPADGVPCLRGDAVELTEALSLRVPMPANAPVKWRRMLGHLEAAFDIT